MKRTELNIAELAVGVIVLLFVYYILTCVSCYSKTQGMDLQTRFTALGGCQVHTSVGWIPIDNYNWSDRGYIPEEGVRLGDQ